MRMEKLKTKSELRILRHFDRSKELSEPTLRAVSEVAERESLSSGKHLWAMGDCAEFFAVVESGIIEITALRESGKETCFGIFGPGHCIGVSAFLRRGHFPAMARAVSNDVSVIKVYLDMAYHDSYSEIFLEINDWLKEEMIVHEEVLRQKIDLLSMGQAEVRTLELIKQISERFGVKSTSSRIQIPVKLSKTLLARLVEIRVETMIRILNRWGKRGLISFHAGEMTIPDLSKLEMKVLHP